MTREKGLRPTSPVHVHVEDDVPVHVHVKQPKKKGKSSSASNLRSSRPKCQRSTVSSRARSKTPDSGPWVPPPGKATKGSKVSWQWAGLKSKKVKCNKRRAIQKIFSKESEIIGDGVDAHKVVRPQLIQGTDRSEIIGDGVDVLKVGRPQLIHRTDRTEMTGDGVDVLKVMRPHLIHRTDRSEIIGDGVDAHKLVRPQFIHKADGPTHRLEIHTPRDSLRMSDLSTDEEDQVLGKMRGYEHKIDNLMSEVGTLKNEVELQKTLRDSQRKEEELNASRQVLEEQELELLDYKEELSQTERENRMLRNSMNMLRDEAEATSDHDLEKNCLSEREIRFLRKSIDMLKAKAEAARVEADILNREREKLMKKLIEVEMDGQAAGKQVSELRDLVRKFRNDSRISAGDSARLAKHKDLLLEKLADFEATNRTLRRLLREQHKQETASLRLSEQRDLLIKKLADTDLSNERLRAELLDRERIIAELRAQIGAQREEVLALSGLQSSLENTRGHLQKELRTKEADCNRLAVQIRTLESDNAQMKIEIDHLRDLVANAREKGERDKEALKKATRVQKQRAAQSEDRVEQLTAELLEKDTKVEDLRTQLEEVSLRLEKSVKERSQASAENTALKTRLDELESLLERVDHNSRSQVEELTAQLHGKTSEVGGLQLENERLKSSIATIETKFRQADEELLQLRSNLKHYEGLVDEYKSQMNQSRKEVDETLIELEDTKRQNEENQRFGEEELEKVKTQLSTRLQELQPLPEMLKTTELKLHDTEDRLVASERKNGESSRLITDLTAKVESLSEQLEVMKDRYQSAQAEDRTMADKLMALERRLQEAEDKNRDLLTTVARREEALHQNNLRLEDRERENASLTRQLENALTDIRRQQEQTRDKQAAKERTLQTRIVDLESQLSQTRAEIARVKREKEENERKFNSRLYDLKDRLEQSHSTNRSMQNYVQFLKNSYANVFGDSTVNMMPTTPIRSGFP